MDEENPYLDPSPEEVDPGGLDDRIRIQNRFSTHPQGWFEWFDEIRRYDYADRYEFKQVEAALDYVLSGSEVQEILTGEARAALRKSLEEEIAWRGSLAVRSDKGLFVER